MAEAEFVGIPKDQKRWPRSWQPWTRSLGGSREVGLVTLAVQPADCGSATLQALADWKL